MAKFIIALCIIVFLLAIYAAFIRPWLKSKAWAKPFFDWIEPIEIALYKKSDTILFARLKVLTGLLLTALTQIGTINLTPLYPVIPDKWEPYLNAAFNMLPLIISFVGWMDERLRISTTKPIELVAIKEAGPVSPEVASAIGMAEAAKAQAVEVVKAAS